MKRVKFAVFTDLHYEHIPDGRQRLEQFIAHAKEESVDFVVDLGDFCDPGDENRVLLDMLASIGKPHYHLIGNHDSDRFAKGEILNFLGMDRSYYSFGCGPVKFIVLDTCFIKTNDGYEPYCRKNHNKAGGIYPVLPDEQLGWLESQLADDYRYFVIFSHHSFENGFPKRGVFNREAVRNRIDAANLDDKRVLMCINGHDHGDSLEKIGQTFYFGLNSMSYVWVGPQFEHFCYSDELHRQYPFLKDMILYREGLHGIVTITETGGIEILGMNGHYQNISPKELGLGDGWNGRPVLPVVSSLKENQAGSGRGKSPGIPQMRN